jgi:hypothetical protein
VALEEFEDYSNMSDAVHVRIANIPLQESLRDLRCADSRQPGMGLPLQAAAALAAETRATMC